MTAGTIDADLEPSGHIALHRLPVPASRESLRRRRCDPGQDRSHRRSHLDRACVEKFPARYCLSRVVIAGAAEERHLVRVIRGRPCANMRRNRPTA